MWGRVTQRGASLALDFGMQRFQRKEDEIAFILGLVLTSRTDKNRFLLPNGTN
jgi:hypothetical protein